MKLISNYLVKYLGDGHYFTLRFKLYLHFKKTNFV